MNAYDKEHLRNNPWFSGMSPVELHEIREVEAKLGRRLPELVRNWIADFGFISIDPQVECAPFLHLLGAGPLINEYVDIVLFNYPDNPSRPENLLLIAHEFDGQNDTYYAVDWEDSVYSVVNWYAWYYFTNKEDYADAKWKKVYASVEVFWKRKVNAYLSGEGFS